MFEIKDRDGLARIADFETPDGTVETPAIMPVINPNLELIPPKKLEKEFGAQILITNSYVLKKNEPMRNEVLEKGVHSLLDFDGAIMTDSGTFQSHVYGELDIDPVEIIEFQKDIGSDISTILDRFTEPDDSGETIREKVEDTVSRAREAVERFRDADGHLALPIQGSVYPEIREKCAGEIADIPGGSFFPIGGVVPLLESYRFSELAEVIIASKKGLGPKGPVHLFGAGHPMLYPLAALLGCDLFDSSSYAKFAKRGDLMYPTGTKNIEDIGELACLCPVCKEHSAGEIKAMEKEKRERLIAEHNLWVSYKEIKKVKQAVKKGNLWEMVERRAVSHPRLYDAMEVLKKEWRWIDKYEPRGRMGALIYSGQRTLDRPAIKRMKRWVMQEYEPPADGPTVLFDIKGARKPYARSLREGIKALLSEHSVNLLVSTPIGPIPLELDETYPIAQSVFPEGLKSEEEREEERERYAETKGFEIVRWEGEETLESLEKNEGPSLDEMRVRTIADYQFGEEAGELFTDGTLEYNKNNKGRIKNVILNGEHILSPRHYDGLFTLKLAGGRLLKERYDSPQFRIVVGEESAKFNAKGRNVFAKFVKDCDPGFRPDDEAVVVDPADELVAVARTFMVREEMLEFDTGMAARLREGVRSSDN